MMGPREGDEISEMLGREKWMRHLKGGGGHGDDIKAVRTQ